MILTQVRQELEYLMQVPFWPFFPVDRSNEKTRRLAGFLRGDGCLAATIDAAIVVVIVLTIMFLAVNTGALPVLCLMHTGALAAGHDAIRLGAVFHVVDTVLPAVESIGFTLGQAAGGDALIDTALLIGLTLIDKRRVGLGKGDCRQNKGKDSEGIDDFHVFSPDG